MLRHPRQLDWELHGLLLAMALLVLAAARWVPWGLLPPVCLWKRWLGFACPSCGMTRSWAHASHGRWMEAFHQNPMGTLLFVATVLWSVSVGVRLLGGPGLVLDLPARAWTALRWGVGLAYLLSWAYVLGSGVA